MQLPPPSPPPHPVLCSPSQVDLLVEAARVGRREGDLRYAQTLLWRASEQLQSLPSVTSSISWGCKWQQAKLLWAEGRERAAEGMRLAKQLCQQMADLEAGLTVAQVTMRVRVLRTLGGWMDSLRCESRTLIEQDLLMKASSLVDGFQLVT